MSNWIGQAIKNPKECKKTILRGGFSFAVHHSILGDHCLCLYQGTNKDIIKGFHYKSEAGCTWEPQLYLWQQAAKYAIENEIKENYYD